MNTPAIDRAIARSNAPYAGDQGGAQRGAPAWRGGREQTGGTGMIDRRDVVALMNADARRRRFLRRLAVGVGLVMWVLVVLAVIGCYRGVVAWLAGR
jgi:hypothetical protein